LSNNKNFSPEFLEQQAKLRNETGEPLAKKAVFVRLPESVDAIVQRLPNKAAWLRRVITEAAKKEVIDRED
jgi:hypothetical protein